MESYCFKNINYTYPGYSDLALEDISFSVSPGEFMVICGASGSGKSTLLRCLKDMHPEFGYVMQEPATQIVTDKVYHELAFSMENKGFTKARMEQSIAETATYFGMEDWMERDTAMLSGGEKQLLNLASEMMPDPPVLLLDEPTSQLDPMAASTFLDMLKRLNDQLGITVILVEQRLEQVLSLCDRMLVLHEGKRVALDTVDGVFEQICTTELSAEFLNYMPSYIRLYHRFTRIGGGCPKNVKECRQWFLREEISLPERILDRTEKQEKEVASTQIKRLYFRYEKKGKDILKDVNYTTIPGHIYGVAGGNGGGKSTFLKLLLGTLHGYHGTVFCQGKVAYLPQETKYMFLDDRIRDIIKKQHTILKFGLEELLDRHPYDISGGQMQRLGMAYLSEQEADIYLFDEPTRGLDPAWKQQFGDWLRELASQGKTVILVSHDVEFAAGVCEYMSMCFHAEISKPIPAVNFFRDHHFYTTVLHRIVRERYPDVISERNLYEG